ncbi:bifunctional hydroxymethylpyrimidine kinase/phosphomethylpyrimidine kinase [Oenococcus sicerae]|uniref:Hydroxymethylpyrimidine/phosphomethylpyrimidine kinase n=1 Tax=Oenococcus sicerae TaxID=2203724 RepID=A0AAJ1RAZ2_9LACO|nr:bifunctional hydroxymethylpyrimidine kinase/phosphomethylpyrimidine kinase [Oenococcus sicerae]MDN6899595.1 bifunctional hydroxymethylpyrimidine kinase/phosphomethylpyrimidine kinase [Oenococcus sicerae]QAS70284.1 bifunctional hydroxymethylpyrimidine kinase/phosphomethylpyrimidine kinase [Oenococcus sicerae]
MVEQQYPEVLTIAGSDSGGGAGIQADIKTMQACHVYSSSILVAITAQNTLDVQAVLPMPIKMINAQFASIYADFDIKAAKTGMLADSQHVRCVVKNIKQYHITPLIVDPVMVAKGGTRLLTQEAIETIIQDLIPLADIVTPNLPEAEAITNMRIISKADFETAAKKIAAMGAKNVIIKGGHGQGKTVSDYVLLADGHDFWLSGDRYDTKRKHGTGDTLSSAITSALAKGYSIEKAIRFGKKFVDMAIKKGIVVGHGHGPLNHWAMQGDHDEI